MKYPWVAAIAVALVSIACGGNVAELEESVAELETANSALEAENQELHARLDRATSTTTSTTPPPQTLDGTFTLTDDESIFYMESTGCLGTGGYDDIEPGVDVVIRGPNDEVVGASALSRGEPNRSESGIDSCEFQFSVEVPTDLDFYTVEVGSRGDITYSRSDLESADWSVTLSLG